MKRYMKQPQQQEAAYNPWATPTIPDGAKVGIYARQSTINQVKFNTTATEMQTDELIAMTKRMGVCEDDVILFIENKRDDGTIKHASGRLRIDQREGLRSLVQRIEAGEIKAVVVFLEDRLFRDETQIQVNTFILICQEYNVLVITPFMTYDFRNPYHVKQFRWKCEQAADFLREYVKERLHGARARAASQGRYDGRGLAVGYIIDRREKIGGLPNPAYKKLIVYEPHAEVVRWIFTRYIALGGNARKLYKELLAIPVLFPAFAKDVDVRNAARLALKKVAGGYHLSYNGLLGLLTNIVYLGWWLHHGEIVQDNHSAIVEEAVFWYAFNRLSDFTPDGEENKREKPKARYTRLDTPEAPALLKEIITTNEQKKAVYCGYRWADWYYYITFRDSASEAIAEKYSVLVDHVDQAFIAKLVAHMRNTTEFEHFRTLVTRLKKEAEQEKEDVHTQIARLERRMQATLVSLTEDPDLPSATRKALNHIYAELEAQRNAVVQPVPAPPPARQVSDLLAYHDLLARLEAEYGYLDFADTKLLAQATTRSVTLDGLSPHCALLTIQWRTPVWGTDMAILWRPYGHTPHWKEWEIDLVRRHYTTMPQEELLALLPHRSWHSIHHKAEKLGIARPGHLPRTTCNTHVCVADIAVMERYGLPTEAFPSDKEIMWVSLPVRLAG
jgi:DNA invertase Pin-like site-specific DNA recombinase